MGRTRRGFSRKSRRDRTDFSRLIQLELMARFYLRQRLSRDEIFIGKIARILINNLSLFPALKLICFHSHSEWLLRRRATTRRQSGYIVNRTVSSVFIISRCFSLQFPKAEQWARHSRKTPAWQPIAAPHMPRSPSRDRIASRWASSSLVSWLMRRLYLLQRAFHFSPHVFVLKIFETKTNSRHISLRCKKSCWRDVKLISNEVFVSRTPPAAFIANSQRETSDWMKTFAIRSIFMTER